MPTTAERVRTHSGPAILSYGFRPFFLFGAVWAALVFNKLAGEKRALKPIGASSPQRRQTFIRPWSNPPLGHTLDEVSMHAAAPLCARLCQARTRSSCWFGPDAGYEAPDAHAC